MTGSSCIGVVTDAHTWMHAAVLMLQLRNHATALPLVAFNVTSLPPDPMIIFSALQVRVVSLWMPVPDAFSSPFLRKRFRFPNGELVPSQYAPYAKLAVWGQTEWSRVVLLDNDIVPLHNIDQMGAFPGDTFAPETCNDVRPSRCSPPGNRITAGMNSGVTVIAPSTTRLDSIVNFVHGHVARLINGQNASVVQAVSDHYLAYPEQSLLKRYWSIVLHTPLEHPFQERAGYSWDWVTVNLSQSRSASFMSRRYNARPFDCSTCADEYLAQVQLVHFTCALKPWHRKRAAWELCTKGGCNSAHYHDMPCFARWALLWHDARDQLCAIAQRSQVALADCKATPLYGHASESVWEATRLKREQKKASAREARSAWRRR